MSENTYPSVNDLTLEEKASLTSGGDAWHLQGVEAKGIPGYMITDGPHGLRKSNSATTGEVDLNNSVPATCFPPAAGLSSSWNPELIHQVGEAMAEECIQEKVAVILGPGVNIKRNPLGGRCFEYWSEDPYLAGHEAVGIVAGVQSKGVGTSLKHFAANSQETDRLRISANISQRALREIYFPAFEHIVKEAQPWTIMCAYNCINGVHAAQDRWLLTDVLRDEWGFQGIVMSDWGADHDRVASLNAGLNLEMPPSYTDDQIVYAARDGRIQPAQLDRMAQGMIDLVNKTRAAMGVENYRFDIEAHDEVAHQAAVESMVLLKNDDAILPVAGDAKVTVIGEFARTPRYQGGGSSHITPTKMTSFLDALTERVVDAKFAPGFTLDLEPADPALEAEAVEAAKGADVVLMFLGLPEAAESEGFDRETLDMPAKQIALLEAVAAENKNVVVVLSNGSVVTVAPWAKNAKGILESWLLGQSGGPALADVLFGKVSPSGKLAQTIPFDINDDPSTINWPGEEGHVDYGEGVFVGYRSYAKRKLAVQYPFGYGLSYTDFAVELCENDFRWDMRTQETLNVPVRVKNVGSRPGSEVVQLYTREEKPHMLRPDRTLVGYAKVRLAPGEETVVNVSVSKKALRCYDARMDKWVQPIGAHTLYLALSAENILAQAPLMIEGKNPYPLNGESTIGEILENPRAKEIVNQFTNGMFDMMPKETLDFMVYRKLNDILSVGMIQVIPDTVKLSTILQGLYDRLAEL